MMNVNASWSYASVFPFWESDRERWAQLVHFLLANTLY